MREGVDLKRRDFVLHPLPLTGTVSGVMGVGCSSVCRGRSRTTFLYTSDTWFSGLRRVTVKGTYTLFVCLAVVLSLVVSLKRLETDYRTNSKLDSVSRFFVHLGTQGGGLGNL